MWVGQHRLQARIIRQITADDGGVQFARQQHVDHLAAFWRALKTFWVRELGQVTVLKGDPFHFGQLNTVVVGQHAAHPSDGGLCMGTNAHPLAIELGHTHFAALSVVHQAVMLKTAFAHHRRQEGQRFAIGLGLQVGDQCQLGDVKFQFTHHTFEGAIGCFDGVKFKVKQLGSQHAVFQSQCVGVIAQQCFEFELFGFHHSHGFHALFKSG